jgi:peptide/nickel transport system substrate-binding protein
MQKKFLWILVGVLVTLSMVLVSCRTSEPSTTPPTSSATTAVTSNPAASKTPPGTQQSPTTIGSGNWWDKLGAPKYGGSINLRLKQDPVSFDPYWPAVDMALWMETVGNVNWTTPPEVSKFDVAYVPLQARVGFLAETFEQPDLQTLILHIRKGVHWENKPPVNGRELTASDVEYTFHRAFGLGSGYDKQSPYRPNATMKSLVSVKATDKYTVVFKWKQPSITMLETIMDFDSNLCIVNREVIEQDGDMRNWEHAVGTGPWLLKNYVAGSSLTVAKNSNYWGYDERYPNNKLPYADSLQFSIIPDDATAMTALRAGKIDLLEDLSWEQAKSLLSTNPELVSVNRPKNGISLDLRCDKAPFNDIKVRKALQMAIDLPTIAKGYYGGTVDPTPVGLVGDAIKGYYIPFKEWPKDLQAEYAYNPDAAKKLLAEAGYPNGFDTHIDAPSTFDIEIIKVLKSYLAKIGVNMEIRITDYTTFRSMLAADKHEAIVAQEYTSGGLNLPLDRILARRYSGQASNETMNNDKVYDSIVDKFSASLDENERKKLMIEADMYAISQHWSTNTFMLNVVSLHSPLLKGFAGQGLTQNRGFFYARYWKTNAKN